VVLSGREAGPDDACLIPVKEPEFSQVHHRNDDMGERTMQHKMKQVFAEPAL
jgi:hypothetical protein